MTKKGKKDPRFTFTLPHQQLQALRQIAKDTGLAVADHIRRSITGYLLTQKYNLQSKADIQNKD